MGESWRALGCFPSARSLDACLPTRRAFVRSGANSLGGAATLKSIRAAPTLRVLGTSTVLHLIMSHVAAGSNPVNPTREKPALTCVGAGLF